MLRWGKPVRFPQKGNRQVSYYRILSVSLVPTMQNSYFCYESYIIRACADYRCVVSAVVLFLRTADNGRVSIYVKVHPEAQKVLQLPELEEVADADVVDGELAGPRRRSGWTGRLAGWCWSYPLLLPAPYRRAYRPFLWRCSPILTPAEKYFDILCHMLYYQSSLYNELRRFTCSVFVLLSGVSLC